MFFARKGSFLFFLFPFFYSCGDKTLRSTNALPRLVYSSTAICFAHTCTVLSTQRYHQHTRCPSWLWILEICRFCGHKRRGDRGREITAAIHKTTQKTGGYRLYIFHNKSDTYTEPNPKFAGIVLVLIFPRLRTNTANEYVSYPYHTIHSAVLVRDVWYQVYVFHAYPPAHRVCDTDAVVRAECHMSLWPQILSLSRPRHQNNGGTRCRWVQRTVQIMKNTHTSFQDSCDGCESRQAARLFNWNLSAICKEGMHWLLGGETGRHGQGPGHLVWLLHKDVQCSE